MKVVHLFEGSCPFEAWANEGLVILDTSVMFGVCFLGVIGGRGDNFSYLFVIF